MPELCGVGGADGSRLRVTGKINGQIWMHGLLEDPPIAEITHEAHA